MRNLWFFWCLGGYYWWCSCCVFVLFAIVFIVGVAYVSSSGVETPLKDGKFLSESGSRWVETGIRTFYILSISAILSMAFSGVKRLIK